MNALDPVSMYFDKERILRVLRGMDEPEYKQAEKIVANKLACLIALSHEMIRDALQFHGLVSDNEVIGFEDVFGNDLRIYPTAKAVSLTYLPKFKRQSCGIIAYCLIGLNNLAKKCVILQFVTASDGDVMNTDYFHYDDWSRPGLSSLRFVGNLHCGDECKLERSM